ncbi:unnamed protein product, partial [Brenthis ino]
MHRWVASELANQANYLNVPRHSLGFRVHRGEGGGPPGGEGAQSGCHGNRKMASAKLVPTSAGFMRTVFIMSDFNLFPN